MPLFPLTASRCAILMVSKHKLKERAFKLGSLNGAAALRRAGKGADALRETVAANADEFARGLAPVVEAIRAERHISLRAIAEQLTTRGMMTRGGGRWHVSNVRNSLGRIGKGGEAGAAALV